MLEPALLRKPVLFGPHTTNFRESAELLLEAGGAVVVRDGAELDTHVGALLVDAERRRLMGEAAFKAMDRRGRTCTHSNQCVNRSKNRKKFRQLMSLSAQCRCITAFCLPSANSSSTPCSCGERGA